MAVYTKAKADFEADKIVDKATVKAELQAAFGPVERSFERATKRFRLSESDAERAPEAV
ncbi:hypothetical protein [Roseibium alexandrii]|uniref:Uncharacterized protein n=2 Tax=Roseibium alexandrii TaxID=388408 RepID=A0A0M7AL12_9HYPH|nr:hypothetical protein [Roseibium alexandrii]EEE44632.1 hypothetical protein SADFL11_1920 [Roseibium alexandrii DFL-11]CTQ75825.1 hypothetical protein LAX5112_04374 [Roseibium alexandrii]